jgi:hypothetical protein
MTQEDSFTMNLERIHSRKNTKYQSTADLQSMFRSNSIWSSGYNDRVQIADEIPQVNLDDEQSLIKLDAKFNTNSYTKDLYPQYSKPSKTNALRYYYLWFLIIVIHYYVFFILVSSTSCAASAPYCNKANSNSAIVVFYIVVCIYLVLQSSQIKYG